MADKYLALLSNHAFEISIVRLAVCLCKKSLACQATADSLFATEIKDAKDLHLYQHFMDAIRQFELLLYQIQHGILTEELKNKNGHGKTGCPGCEGDKKSTNDNR
ncbi:hypothetical protein HK100_007969, partial [Physocladia obscura]